MLIASENTAIIYCGSVYCYDDETLKIHKDSFYKGKVFDRLIEKNFIGGASFPLMRTELLRSIGGFDIEMQACQDVDTWLRLARLYLVDYVAEPLVIYHLHNGEQISSNSSKRINGIKRKIEKNCQYFQTHKKQYYTCLVDLAVEYIKNKEIANGTKCFIRAMKEYPYNISKNVYSLYRMIKWIIKNL